MQKENLFFFSLSSESTFDEVKGNENRAQNKINVFIFYAEVHLTLSKVRLSEDNAKGKFMKQRYFLVVMFLLVSLPYVFLLAIM